MSEETHAWAREAEELGNVNAAFDEAFHNSPFAKVGSVESALENAPSPKAPEAAPAPAAAPPPAAEAAPPVPVAPPPAPAVAPDAVTVFVREQAAARAEIEAAKAEARAAAAEKAELARKMAEIEEALKANPLKAAERYGWDLEAIQAGVLQGRTPEAVRVSRLEAELAEMKAAQARTAQEAVNAAEARTANAALEAFKDTAHSQFQAIEASFPLTSKFMEPQELRESLYDVMAAEFKKSGDRLTTAQAAQRLEDQLSARVKRLQATPTAAPTAPAAASTRTITNTDTTGVTPSPEAEFDDLTLSSHELAERAVAAIRRVTPRTA